MIKENKNGISVILPIHELTDETKVLFGRAVQSILDQKTKPEGLIVVTPINSEALTYLEGFDFKDLNVTIVKNEGKTDFSSQINLGVSKSKTEWFSILELDDEYSNIWFDNVVKYKEVYGDVGVFLPVIVDVNAKEEFIGFTNEAVWAAEFSDIMGQLDINCLLKYQNFNFGGMVMKKSIYEENGGLKASMKLTFIYEFFLRMVNLSVNIMVIPKFGYKHVNQREGSLFNDYKNNLSIDEARWWMATAKKEYYHTNDRNITYSKEMV